MTTQEQIHFIITEAKFGLVLIAKSKEGVCAILINIDNNKTVLHEDLKLRFPEALLVPNRSLENEAFQIARFIHNPATKLNIQLDVRGTPFQKRVWKFIRQISIGKTVSYADIARGIKAPKAFRAVAQACARNPLAVVIPCHRVIKSDGGLSGYRWGIGLKRKLLAIEAPQ